MKNKEPTSLYNFYKNDKTIVLSHDNRTLCKFEENGRKYLGENPKKKLVTRFQVDGGIITSELQKKCDKALLIDEEKLYLIELKGSDMNMACKQLLSTYEILSNSFENYKYYFRIVLSKAPSNHSAPNKISYAQQKLEKMINKDKEKFKYESILLKECI